MKQNIWEKAENFGTRLPPYFRKKFRKKEEEKKPAPGFCRKMGLQAHEN